MAAESEVIKLSYTELEDLAKLEMNERPEDDDLRKKKDDKKKRPSLGVYTPPHRHKGDADQGKKDGNDNTDRVGTAKKEENSETPSMSSNESSVDRELESTSSGDPDNKSPVKDATKSTRLSEEGRKRNKKPEIQRYVPKGRQMEQQTDTSREGSVDKDVVMASPNQLKGQTTSSSPISKAAAQSPSPRKIDPRNLQVTVVNDKDRARDCQTPEKIIVDNIVNNMSDQPHVALGRGQGTSNAHGDLNSHASKGRGHRQGQRLNRPNDAQNFTRQQGIAKTSVHNEPHSNENSSLHISANRGKNDAKSLTEHSMEKDIKPDQELYIVPCRPSTIGQEADRKDTAPVGMEKVFKKIDERNKNMSEKRDRSWGGKAFTKVPTKCKSRSYDRLNQSEGWGEEEKYYADQQKVGTMVFERSHSSEQLNLSGRNLGKPPTPRSSSGVVRGAGGGQKRNGEFRKRTDSFSSDVSAGTGSDWSTEELDFDKEIDNTSKIDWNEDVERELALQVQDETQKMKEWFQRQELGLSQKETLKDNSNNARDNVMTSSIPGYQSGFLAASMDTGEKCNTLPFTRRKQLEDPRGRQANRPRGLRSRDSSLSSAHSVQSVHSVQSAYSGDGRRRRRRRRKSSAGSQKMTPGSSIENMNIQVTCGGRREVKVDEGTQRKKPQYGRQSSNEKQIQQERLHDHQYRKGSYDEGRNPRGFHGDERGRGRGRGGRGRGFDKMGSHEHAEETYNARERWERDEKRWHHQQNSKQPQYQKNEHREDYQREDTYNSHSNSRRNTHRGKGNYEQFDDRRGDDRKSDFYSSRGNRQEKRQDNVKAGRQAAKDMETKPISDNKHKRNEDYQKEEDMYGEHDPSRHDHVHKGGLLHLPSQQEPEQKADSHQQRVTDAHGSNIARGDNGDRSSNGYHRERQHSGPSAVNVYSRDRHNSGPGRQKTLFDPNNPSKPIVIEEAVPRMEFKDTDSFSSSPMSPQYEGTPPASDVYSRGYGPFPPPPMGYCYGYGMPAIAGMMTPGPPMFYGYPRAPVPHPYMGEESYEAYQHGHYEGEGAPMMGMGPRGKSQNQMMAEHLLREAVPLDKQLSSLLARRLNGEETLNIINQLRQQIMVRCERVILLDLEMSSDRGVEQMMWKTVFHQMVELIRKQLAEDRTEETRFMLHNILDEGTTFYEGLISKLQSTCKFDLEPFLDPEQLPPENRSRNLVLGLLSVQRCFICLGDIARYKEQNNNSGKINYAKARNWYLKAQQIAPKNGRPYNQLAILALYTKHKLDAVYYYMRSLASSNPFLTAREGLMTLFNEARKKAEVSEQKRYEEKKKQESLRQSRNLREHRVEIWVKNDGTSSTSQVDDSYGDDLSKLDTIQLNKRFVVSFLNVQGKLFTKIGMEMFPDICGQMLHEFRALLKAGAIGPQRLLQLMAMNMFAIDNTALKDESLESTCRSLLQQHSVQMSLDMFGILLKESATLLAAHIKSNDYPGRMYSRELEELIPGVKVWTDWMISHPDLWNPPPQVRDPSCGPKVDVWECVARLYNLLAEMNTSDIVKFYTDRRQGLLPVILSEDTMMSGFVPLLGKPTINNFVQEGVDMDMARDCLRVQQLQIFGLYLCGMEERPMLKYMDGRYYSVAPPDGYGDTDQAQTAGAALGSEGEDEDVVIEDEEEVSVEGDHDANVQELKARREELRRRVDEKNRIQENRNRVLEKNKTHSIEMEVRPIFLIPDTNCFIDHLPSLQKLIVARHYTIVIPLVVINELDGLAQGKRPVGDCSADNDDHRHKVKTRAQHTITFLEKEFETKNAHLKALTSKGTVMETIAFRSEETDSSGNNDDLILSCCTYYCKDKARDFMPKDKDTPIRLFRDVVLLTEDRNLRLKAHMHNVPVKDVPAFMKWSTAT